MKDFVDQLTIVDNDGTDPVSLLSGGRFTYGHSLIIAPWGEVLADGGDQEGFVAADCDFAEVDMARKMIRAIHHSRPFAPA